VHHRCSVAFAGTPCIGYFCWHALYVGMPHPTAGVAATFAGLSGFACSLAVSDPAVNMLHILLLLLPRWLIRMMMVTHTVPG
jgi:hypothetical protein